MATQIGLQLSLNNDSTFNNFLVVDETRREARYLFENRAQTRLPLVFIWGGNGSGVSHFAQAVCSEVITEGDSAQFLPLDELVGFDAESLLEGLESMSLVCLEDIHSVASQPQWERELFKLYNKILDQGQRLLVTADRPPQQLPLQLPDLVSRLASGATFHFSPYSDEQKRDILQFRAIRLGIEMTDEVANYLLNRCSRQLEDLMTILQQLDVASLEAKRRITIPFIKDYFRW